MKTRITIILFISLLFSAKISPAAEMEDSPLIRAIKSNESTEHIQSLIKEKANVNEKCPHGNTILMLVSQAGRADLVQLLIDENADVNEGPGNCSALCVAEQNSEVQKILLNNGAQPHSIVSRSDNYSQSIRDRLSNLGIN